MKYNNKQPPYFLEHVMFVYRTLLQSEVDLQTDCIPAKYPADFTHVNNTYISSLSFYCGEWCSSPDEDSGFH